MKLAIPILDKNENSEISSSLGRAPYYLVYDVENKEVDFLDNSAASSMGGAGIRSAELLVGEGIGGVIAVRCGKNAAEVFGAADVKLIQAESSIAMENIRLFRENKLKSLTNIHQGFHKHGSRR